MATESKRKKLTYKVAHFMSDLGDSTITLESLLRRALRKVSKAYNRFQNPQADGIEFQFLNYSGSHVPREDQRTDSSGGIFGCEFLAYEKGADQSTLSINQEAEEIDVDSIIPDEGKEFLAGSVYFGVHKNHVILLPSRGLRSAELEAYLNWFLSEKAKVLPDGNLVQLNDHVSAKRKQKIKGVKNISFSAPIHVAPDEAPQSATKTKGKSYAVKMVGSAWEAVKSLVGADVLPATFSVGDLADTPELEVRLLLTWKGRRGEDDAGFLDGVASNLRHIDDEVDYSIEAESGSITRDQIKLFQPYQIRWNKGRPDFSDVFPKMAEWLEKLIIDGRVDT